MGEARIWAGGLPLVVVVDPGNLPANERRRPNPPQSFVSVAFLRFAFWHANCSPIW